MTMPLPATPGLSGALPAYCTPLTGIGDTVAIAVMLVFMFIAGAWALGPVFSRPGWRAWARVEFYQAIITLFLLANAAFFASVFCQSSVYLAGGDPFRAADDYLNTLVWTNAIPAMMELFTMGFVVNVFSQYSLQISTGAWGWSYSSLAGLKAIANNIGLIEAILAPLISSLMLQQIGLHLIQATAFQLVLPIGILLRAFSITRDAGSFLMAAAFGLYVVLPLTYVLNKQVSEVIWTDVNNPGSALGKTGLCDVPLDPGTTGRFGISYFNPQRWCHTMLVISHVIPQAVFLPALSMVITTTFIKAMTKTIIHQFGE